MTIIQENKDHFMNIKKEKDAYDIEYDKGKLKKIKNKKSGRKNLFNNTFDYLNRKKEQS